MANTYLTRTLGTPTNNKKWTLSAWIKKGHIGGDINTLFSAGGDSSNYQQIWSNYNSGQLQYYSQVSGGSALGSFRLSNRLRDVSGWYNLVISFDSANVTDSERLKIYINGNQETDTSVGGDLTYPTQNQASLINSAIEHTIGKDSYRNASYLDSSVSHLHFIDGTAYDASAFGSTDATTGEWEAKTSPSVTYGNNGFFILKDGNGITDQSGEGNDFTLGGGTLTDLKDNPDNVFATFMPLIPRETSGDRNPTFSNGNTTASFNNSNSNLNAVGSIALKGKYYWETKWVSAGSDGSATTGIVDLSSYDNSFIGNQCVGYEDDGNKINEGTATSYGSTYASGNIIGTAFDSTTGTIWFSKDGVWQNSATISEIASGTTTNSAYTGLSTSVDWLPLATNYQSRVCNVNFGNGFFGTTAITTNSGNGYAGAEGASKFNYTVPAGYSALNTKGLNE
jgi:hypothetical protein